MEIGVLNRKKCTRIRMKMANTIKEGCCKYPQHSDYNYNWDPEFDPRRIKKTIKDKKEEGEYNEAFNIIHGNDSNLYEMLDPIVPNVREDTEPLCNEKEGIWIFLTLKMKMKIIVKKIVLLSVWMIMIPLMLAFQIKKM